MTARERASLDAMRRIRGESSDFRGKVEGVRGGVALWMIPRRSGGEGKRRRRGEETAPRRKARRRRRWRAEKEKEGEGGGGGGGGDGVGVESGGAAATF